MKRFLASAGVVLLLDQASKLLVRQLLTPTQIVPLIGDVLRLRYVHNPGAAFGFFQGNRYLFIGISLAAIAVILVLILTKRYTFRGSRTAFGLVLGGALGNLIDRLWLSEVVDFIDVGIGVSRWPTFNIADAGVTLGVIYLVVSVLTMGRGRLAAADVDSPAAGDPPATDAHPPTSCDPSPTDA